MCFFFFFFWPFFNLLKLFLSCLENEVKYSNLQIITTHISVGITSYQKIKIYALPLFCNTCLFTIILTMPVACLRSISTSIPYSWTWLFHQLMAWTWPQTKTLTQPVLSPLALQMGSETAIHCIFVSTQIRMSKPNPQSDGVQRRVLRLVTRSWCREWEPNKQGQVGPRTLSTTGADRGKPVTHGAAGRHQTLRQQARWSGTFHVYALQSLRNKQLMLVSHPVYEILLQQPEQTKMHIQATRQKSSPKCIA